MEKQCLEEVLGIIWALREQKEDTKQKIVSEIKQKLDVDSLDELVSLKYVVIDNDKIKFTQSGESIARDLIRRERLAERLLSDVLEIKKDEMTNFVCECEHILSKEVETSICILLGHPRQCPHGYPIPEGDCCKKAKNTIESIVVPLSTLKPSQKAKILYILAGKDAQLHKLMSLGIVPGNIINMHQTYPSFIIQSGETQIALEEEIAANIFVKRV